MKTNVHLKKKKEIITQLSYTLTAKYLDPSFEFLRRRANNNASKF
jgi:hypothetical protein